MSARGKSRGVSLGAPPRPQVNLLPPEVRSKRALSVTKRWMGIIVAVSLLVAVALVVYAMSEVRVAERRLADEQAETTALLKEQATYADVPLVLGALDRAKAARSHGMANDILWEPYLEALAAVAPDEVSFEEVLVAAPSPVMPLEATSNPVIDFRVGAVTVVGRATEMPDTAEWMRQMESIPGLKYVYFTSAPITEDGELVFYEFTVSAQVDPAALSDRWAPEDELTTTEEGK